VTALTPYRPILRDNSLQCIVIDPKKLQIQRLWFTNAKWRCMYRV